MSNTMDIDNDLINQIESLTKRVQEAEGETSIVKGIGMNSPEMKAAKKEIVELKTDLRELVEEMKEYRDGMVARNFPFQWISDIITKWEVKKVKTVSQESQDDLEPIKDFLEESEKEKKELEESYQESLRQTKERKAKERLTGPIDSFSEDLQNSIKERKEKDGAT
tara:strand:- start:3381 stop:3878 length:498 start_codon:yes stop_codon:yes gene_type:complete